MSLAGLKLVVFCLVSSLLMFGQDDRGATTTLPRLIRYSGTVSGVEGGTPVGLTFALYESEESRQPLWIETQSVTVYPQGRYSVLLGATSVDGLPSEIFSSGQARWLRVTLAAEDFREVGKMRVTMVPYAIAAGNAETLGGRPLSDFVLTRAARLGGDKSSQAAAPEDSVTSGTADRIAKFVNGTDLGDSVMTESGGKIGIGTTSPVRDLHIRSGAPSLRLEDTNFPNSFWELQQSAFVNDTFGFLRYESNTAVESKSMVISAAGNMGVGTAAPQRKLHIKGPGPAIRIEDSTLPNSFWELQQSAFVTDTFGFLRYENGSAIPSKSMVISSSGLMGVGTQFPLAKLHVAGSLRISGAGEGLTFPDGSNQFTAFNSGAQISDVTNNQIIKIVQNAAGVGTFSVGTPPPVAIRGDATSGSGLTAGVLGVTSATLGRGVLGESLSTTGQNMGVYGLAVNSPDGTGVWGEATSTTGDAAGVFGRSASVTGTGIFGEATATSGDAAGVAGVSRAAGGTGVQGEVTATSGENYGISGRVFNNTTAGSTAGMFINTNTNAATGSLLLGRTNTAQGQPNVFRVDTAGKGFFNGGTQMGGADFAESVAVREERAVYEPGDVIAIDTTGVRRFAKVAKAYSTLVAGIYSTKPGVLATPHHPEDPRIASEEIPLAVVGIVPCKVTNENGQIRAGDLLVASSREGYAMKGTDQKRMNGAVIGKALQPLKGATGVIEVLVSLQ